MRSFQGKKYLVMIYNYSITQVVSLCSSLEYTDSKYMWEKITLTVLPLDKYYHSLAIVQLRMKKKMSDSSQICDYRFLSIIITNQSTNIEYYRLIDYVFDDRFRSISYALCKGAAELNLVSNIKWDIPKFGTVFTQT